MISLRMDVMVCFYDHFNQRDGSLIDIKREYFNHRGDEIEQER